MSQDLTPRQIGELIEDLREELEEIRMETNLLESRLKQGDLNQDAYKKEKVRLNDYMKKLIARITDLQKTISKKDRDLAREIRQLTKFFQIDDMSEDNFIIYLSASPEHLYTIQFTLSNYPDCPKITWPQNVYEDIGDPGKFLKQIREWDPAYPTPVYEIFQAFEQYAWNYFNAVQELKNELRDIEGQFVMQLLKDNYIRITMMSFNKREFSVEASLENYPKIEWVFPPEVSQLLGPSNEFILKYEGREKKPRMIDVLNDIAWEIDKNTKLAFDFKVLQSNASEAISGLELDPKKKTIKGFINGELKTETTRFEFLADFSKGYPENPPEISITPVGEVDQTIIGKLQHHISESGASWKSTSMFLDLLNKIHLAIFKSSIITCVICHKLFCPACDEPLYLPKGVEGKTCYVECSNCKRPYHKHCFDSTIVSIGKCAVCMQSFVASDGKGGKASLELDLS